jgi:hypothetical protein
MPAKIALMLALVALSGCQTLETATDRLNCTPSFCVRDYSHAKWGDAPEQYGTLLVLPPRYTLVERALDGSEQPSEEEPDRMPDALYEAIDRPASSYQFSLVQMVAETGQEKERVADLHRSLWRPAVNPETLIRETPLFGSPEIEDPIATQSLSIPDILRDHADAPCCVLVTRITGWTDTKGARSAKVATAAILSVLPGASGVAADGGDALTDMAVVRLDDGAVVWSSRTLGTGHVVEIKRAIQPFFSKIYNARHAPE